MSLTKVSYAMVHGAPVNLLDFIPAGVDTATTDCSAYIQAALDSEASDVVIYGSGLTYLCHSGIVIKGGNKTLDMGNGTLIFVNSTPTYAVTIETVTATAAGQEFNNGIKNCVIECSGLTSGGQNNIGIYIHNKVLNALVENVQIKSVDGSGIYVDGGLDGSGGFMSPDKGTIRDVTIDSCTLGVTFICHSTYETMSGWTLDHIYAPTCGTAFYIKGCAEFTMIALATESFVSYGLRLDDQGWGGGHVCVGGFFESPGLQSVTYENANPDNRNIVLFKGAFGAPPVDLLNQPSMAMGFGSVQLNNEEAKLIIPGDSDPVLLTTSVKGCRVNIFAAGPATDKTSYAEYYLGGDIAGTTYTPQSIFNTDAGIWTTTKNSGGGATYKINVYYTATVGSEYPSSPAGYYVQNQAVGGGSLLPYLSIKLLKGYG